ncbi:hypothetical protein KM043_001409 [Ampulex compressa]|nr:hypothetical protein KM043_001409 [Ampulex compressa]
MDISVDASQLSSAKTRRTFDKASFCAPSGRDSPSSPLARSADDTMTVIAPSSQLGSIDALRNGRRAPYKSERSFGAYALLRAGKVPGQGKSRSRVIAALLRARDREATRRCVEFSASIGQRSRTRLISSTPTTIVGRSRQCAKPRANTARGSPLG